MSCTPFQHASVDAVIPAAMAIVGAVHDRSNDRSGEFLDAIADAARVGGPAWQTALIVCLAGLVPENCTIGELTLWMYREPLVNTHDQPPTHTKW